MEEFIIYLAKHAKWDRFLHFPDVYRRTTKYPNPYSKDEYDIMRGDLVQLDKHPELRNYILDIPIKLTKHEDIHNKDFHEYEFKYSFIDNFIRDKKYKERFYLYHGSNIGNWYSILRNGIKNMSGTPFMTNGQSMGPGVYMTTNLSMAISYGSSGEYNCVAIIELLIDPAPFSKKCNVYVVPDDKILFPRFMLMTKSSNISIDESTTALQYHKRQREKLIQDNTKRKRLDMDLEQIKSYLIEELPNYCFTLIISDCIIRMMLHKYPFNSPVFQLVYELQEKSDHFDDRGLFIYPYEEWSAMNKLIDVVQDIERKLSNSIQTKKEIPHLLE